MKIATIEKLPLKAVYLRRDGHLWMKVHPIFQEDGPKHSRACIDEMEPKICFGTCSASEKANPNEKVLVLAD